MKYVELEQPKWGMKILKMSREQFNILLTAVALSDLIVLGASYASTR